jgi:PAS domain S-box-containing protein
MAKAPAERRTDATVEQFSKERLGAIIVASDDGRVLSWNEGATSLYGFRADEVDGGSLFDTIIAAEQAEAMRTLLAEAIASGSGGHEAIHRCRDERRIWVDLAVRSHTEGGSQRLVLNARDITRAHYNRGAQMLHARFREVLEAAPDAIVLIDATGRIALVNTEAERLFGYARGELVGELIEALVPSRFHAAHPGHRRKYFSEPKTRPMGTGLNLSGRRKDGSEFPVEISLSPLEVDDSHLAMAAIRDVSSRKRTEEALRVANSDLESFTYSVSHDLRAPIRQIDGFTRLLVEKLGATPDDDTRHYLRRIEEGARYMGRLVDDLLDLSRLGRQQLQPRPVALGEIVSGVVADLRLDLGDRSVSWEIGELPTVDCDPGLVKVVFTNLLSNALKYSRPREVARIEVGAAPASGPSGVFVRDNGVGFDMQYADKLFGVFQRLHGADEFEGTGVGLATVQRIVRKHGGEIAATAELGKGATFMFSLAPSPADLAAAP